MKRHLLLSLVLSFTITLPAQNFRTIKVGESISAGWVIDNGITPVQGGNAIGVKLATNGAAYIYGVQPGYASCGYYKNVNSYSLYCVHVRDVIPQEMDMIVGGSYTYSPVVYSGSSNYETFTWSSNNTAVATVNAKGILKAVGAGSATITCTANGGNSFSSVVHVSAQSAQQIKLNKNEQDLDVGQTAQLTATVSPSNTTNKALKWLSSNENIAQVDDEGNVTAIAPGYCSILCIADDGSKKYDKCLVHVQGESASRADVNGDGKVSVTDAFSVIDVILNQ